MMKKLINNKKGFTMIELLATVVILGILSVIGIQSVSRLIEKSREEQLVQQEKTIEMAAQSYLQANRNLLPKSIGESKRIKVSDLKNSKYIKEDIKNSRGKSCMENSYVRVYKLSKSEYTYTTYLYCGNDVVPAEESIPEPTIKVYFTDANDKSGDEKVFNNVSEARIHMELTGGKTEAGTPIDIDGYSFSLSAKVGDEPLKEVYNSGTLSANRNKSLTIIKKVTDYVDITKATYLEIQVNVRNVAGGLKELTSATSDPSSKATYKDTTSPKCSLKNHNDADIDWINKYSTEKERKITVVCSDGDGSGCIRDTFTRTWPNPSQKDAEYSYIQVVDNAGNKSRPDSFANSTTTQMCDSNTSDNDDGCRVKVFVDLTAPSISVTAHKSGSDFVTPDGGNIFSNESAKTANDANTNVEVSSNSYKNLVNGWMNLANYQYGVIYKVTVKDTLHLASWTWTTNPDSLTDTNDAQYSAYSLNNVDAARGSVPNSGNKNCGTREHTFYVGFHASGKRKGKLSVKDAAGNETVMYIEANVDRTKPPVPSTIVAKKYRTNDSTIGEEDYTWGSWSNLYVATYPIPTTGEKGNSVSDWSNYEYEVRKAGVAASDAASTSAAEGQFVFNSDYQGKNKVRFKSCNKSGNCSDYTQDFEVWLDTVGPRCKVTAKDNNNENYDGSWKKIGESVTVSSECNEAASDTESGCTATGNYKRNYSFTYSTNINSNKASASGDGVTTKVIDIAGNVTNCENKTVKVDIHSPTCDYGNEWSNWTKNDRTITWNCKDTASSIESGCVALTNNSKTFTTTTDTYTINEFSISDKAGNTASCPAKTRSVKVDKTAPICSVTGQNTTWTKSNVTISLGCIDTDSGCATQTEKQTYKTSAKTDTKSYTIKDNAGNTTNCNETFDVYVDKTKPECKITYNGTKGDNGWYKAKEVTVSLNPTDPVGEVSIYGLSTVEKTEDGEIPYNNKKTATQGDTGNGSIKYYGFVKDAVGNTGTCNSSVKVDTKAPTRYLRHLCNKTIKTGSTNTKYKDIWVSCFTDDASGSTGSGVKSGSGTYTVNKKTYKYKNPTKDVEEYCEPNQPGYFNVSNVLGISTKYKYTIKDTAGNAATWGEATLKHSCKEACGPINVKASTSPATNGTYSVCECGGHSNYDNTATGANLRQHFKMNFKITGCKTGLSGRMCYRWPQRTGDVNNPGRVDCGFGQATYSKGAHFVVSGIYGRTGHACFKDESNWYYYRSINFTWAQACNKVDGVDRCDDDTAAVLDPRFVIL